MRSFVVFMSVVLVLAFLGTPASAIERVRLGPKAGLHLSQVSGDYTAFGITVDEGWTSKQGVCLGLLFNVGINRYLSIQPELYFVVKGTEGEFEVSLDGFEGIGEYDFRLDYWELPILAKVTVPTGLFFSPFVTAGPYVGYLSKADREAYFTETGGHRGGIKHDIAGQINRMDYGVAAGGGIDFSIGSKILLFAEARYQLGLSNIRKDTNDLKNRSFSFTTGFSLPIYTP